MEIYTDGACSGNPGIGGWGVLLRVKSIETELFGGDPATTNNRMELRAVIEALEYLTQPVEARIYTDSQYVQKGISIWIHSWKRRGWKTASNEPVKNEDLWRRLDALTVGHRLEWHWVRGHAGHPDNERVDALARAGLEQARQAAAGSVETAGEIAYEKLLQRPHSSCENNLERGQHKAENSGDVFCLGGGYEPIDL